MVSLFAPDTRNVTTFEWTPEKAIATTARVRAVFVLLALIYATVVVTGMPEWLQILGIPRWLFVVGLPVALATYTGLLDWGARSSRLPPKLVIASGLLGDLVCATVALLGTGGPVSGVWALYLLITLEAAYLTNQVRVTVGVALFATILYVALVMSNWDFLALAGFRRVSGHQSAVVWLRFAPWYEVFTIIWMTLMQIGTVLLSIIVIGQRDRYHDSLVTAYRQLDQQFASLKQLDRLKNSFLSTVSHELRTPLTILQGCQELMSEQSGISRMTARYIEESRKATALLAQRVNLMLAYTTLASGEETLALDNFNPGELFEWVTNQQRANLAQAGVSLNCQDTNLGTFWGDRAWLTEALNQLVLNAIRACASGGQIWLGARSDDNHNHLLVSDDGPGLPETIRKQFGEPFVQADWRLTEHAPGLGLGLAFAKLVSLAHHGQLGYHDRPGGGTVITLSLPRLQSPALPQSNQA